MQPSYYKVIMNVLSGNLGPPAALIGQLSEEHICVALTLTWIIYIDSDAINYAGQSCKLYAQE